MVTEISPEISPEISIESEMKKSYLDYAMSVIIGRALPDVRDGLKPVHRRVLFAMRELKNDWNKPYKKSARIVGDVIGKYHPHGDTAVYDTIVRMTQDFSLRYPLVDGQGNFGSIDGDSAAAMRYTEIRMAKIAHEMLIDLDKETVDFVPNYDESMSEPRVLPTKIPALLVNGSSGIAVGMATNIPPHNLTEVVNALNALIDNPEITWQELMEHVPGPDFPTSGIIYGTNGIYEAYKTGRGIIRVRAKVRIEEDRKGNQETIVVDEIPYQVNKARLIEKIAELMKHKQIEGLRYVRDESDREGMRIAMGLKKDQVAEVIINQLYKHTQMETSFGIILLAVINNRPKVFNFKELLEQFILHRKDVIVRRTRYELRKAEERAHILEGLKIALENLDEVVALIRSSSNALEAKSRLVETFSLTLIQAQAILDMRLQRLTGLEREKIIEEYENLLKDIAWFKEILSSERLILNIVKEELAAIQQEFGDKRRTEIVEATRELTLEDMIVEEDMVVTISKDGYIKRNPITLYQSQRRGGKGKTAMGTKEEDFVELLFVASTHHTFLFFTSQGKVYWCKVYQIPQAGRASKGKAIVNLLNFEQDEKLTTVLAVPAFEPGSYIMMATKNGLVKKTDIMAYSRPRVGGIIALNLNEGDELITARITDGNYNAFLCSASGKSIRFHESGIRPTGRTSKGVRGIRLVKDDILVGMEVLSHGQTLFAATENGYGKRTLIDEYPVQKRGGKGVITIKTSERNGKVVAILLVDEENDLMLMTDRGKLIRMPIRSISVISRNTQGVKLIGMDASERVIGAARLAEAEKEEDDDEQGMDAEEVVEDEHGLDKDEQGIEEADQGLEEDEPKAEDAEGEDTEKEEE
ncbi:DNA gyrase subunit A [Desulfobacterales bacterium HSG17]|nr:DNA gyrase subunit A [Desulfobacterales bacterium HSG17]